MATVKRMPYRRPLTGGAQVRGEVNTAGCEDGRPAVLILLGAKASEYASARLMERLARAGLTAISAAIVPGRSAGTLEEAAGTVARFAGDLLAGRHAGLAAPRAVGLFGANHQALLAIAVAAREPRVVSLVTRDPKVPGPMEASRLAALSAGVRARWLEIRSGKKVGRARRTPEKVLGPPQEVRYLETEAQVMDAAVAWFAAMLS